MHQQPTQIGQNRPILGCKNFFARCARARTELPPRSPAGLRERSTGDRERTSARTRGTRTSGRVASLNSQLSIVTLERSGPSLHLGSPTDRTYTYGLNTHRREQRALSRQSSRTEPNTRKSTAPHRVRKRRRTEPRDGTITVTPPTLSSCGVYGAGSPTPARPRAHSEINQPNTP
jgi:hypothetical protein